MSEPSANAGGPVAPNPPRDPPHKASPRIAVGRVIVRAYALTILLLVLWTGYIAVSYLFHSVFSAETVPPNIRRWERPVTLNTLHAAAEGTVAELPRRAPYAHFHGVGAILEAGPPAGCSTSGCHQPLPHTQRKEIRAFANFHTTFLDCQMCHAKQLEGRADARWVRTADNEPTDPPAALRLVALLETKAEALRDTPAAVHDDLLRFLRETVDVAGRDPILDYLRIQIETSEPGSPAWRHAVTQLAAELPNHTRGEYGTKIALADARSGDRRDMEVETERYLSAAPNSPAREQAYEKLHDDVLAEPKGCVACHAEPARLDFEKLGYPPSRAAVLKAAPIAHMTQQILDGKAFHLPRLLEGER